jgi:hypothetical protein
MSRVRALGWKHERFSVHSVYDKHMGPQFATLFLSVAAYGPTLMAPHRNRRKALHRAGAQHFQEEL